jgi:4-amino-4-deoxy-L-arabinose transferase-like glycosyltransferase
VVSSSFLTFTGANRSGWAGILLCAAILMVQTRRWRSLATVAVMGLASFAAISWLGTTEVLEYRVNQTREGYESDDFRQQLFLTAVDIALENPVLGVTPQRLPQIMASRTQIDAEEVETHNLTAYLVAGGGFPVLLAFSALLFVLFRYRRRSEKPASPGQQLMTLALAVFVFRSMFSAEILFTPGFAAVFGLTIGLIGLEVPSPGETHRDVRRS